MSITKNVIAALALAATLGLSACGTTDKGTAIKHDPTPVASATPSPSTAPVVEATPEPTPAPTPAPPPAPAPKPKPVANPDVVWALAFVRGGATDLMDEVADHSEKAGDAATAYDVETAADESWETASASKKVVTLIDSLDESEGSPLATDSRRIWQQCTDAYSYTAGVLDSYSLGQLDQATAGITTCSTGIDGLTRRVTALT